MLLSAWNERLPLLCLFGFWPTFTFISVLVVVVVVIVVVVGVVLPLLHGRICMLANVFFWLLAKLISVYTLLRNICSHNFLRLLIFLIQIIRLNNLQFKQCEIYSNRSVSIHMSRILYVYEWVENFSLIFKARHVEIEFMCRRSFVCAWMLPPRHRHRWLTEYCNWWLW